MWAAAPSAVAAAVVDVPSAVLAAVVDVPSAVVAAVVDVPSAVLAAVGAGAAVALLWWSGALPGPSAAAVRLRAEKMRRRRVPNAGAAAAVAGAAAGAAGAVVIGPLPAVGAAAAGAACAWAMLVRVASRRAVAGAADMAQFCSGLANQSSVAATVEDALRRAAPAASGALAGPAARLVAEAEAFGVAEAAARFADRIGTATSRRIAAVVAMAGEGGSGWAHLAEVAQHMATEDLATRQHFHRRVAALMPQIVSAVAVAVAAAAAAGLLMADVGDWFRSADGQLVLLVTGLLWAGIISRVCSPAWRLVR